MFLVLFTASDGRAKPGLWSAVKQSQRSSVSLGDDALAARAEAIR